MDRRKGKNIMRQGFFIFFCIYSVVIMLLGGFAGTADALPLIDNIQVLAHNADDIPVNQYGIRLSKITVEGDLDESDREILGSVNLVPDLNGNGTIDLGESIIQVRTGDLRAGGHDLRVTAGTHIVDNGADDMIETNDGGEFTFTFNLPANVVGSADVTFIMFFGNEAGDLDPAIYHSALLGTLPADAGTRDFEFAVQTPCLVDGQVPDYTYRNGSIVDIQLHYETPFGGPPLAVGMGIELLTILPDFSNIDSGFALGMPFLIKNDMKKL